MNELDQPFEAESEYLYRKKIKELQEEIKRLQNLIDRRHDDYTEMQ